MENQHRKIRGYRELTKAEIDLMNEIKDVEARTAAVIRKMGGRNADPVARALDMRSLAVARTHLQTGFMWAVRAVAKPESGWDDPENG